MVTLKHFGYFRTSKMFKKIRYFVQFSSRRTEMSKQGILGFADGVAKG